MRQTVTKRITAIILALALITGLGAALAEDDRFYAIDALETLGFELQEHKGKVIVINFFTTWCYYCAQEMPDFKMAFETYSPDDLHMLLVHVWDNETGDSTAPFVEKHGLENMTVLEDADHVMAAGVGIPAYPTTLIIDKEGYLAQGIVSAMNYEALSRYLDDLGAMKAENGAA